jgi:CelD/BcsL family acetyltransferase involved in cellulose biosynthesis
LIEARSLGRLSFAGEPVSPHRGLLCAVGFEDSAWLALAQYLDTCSYRWVTLDAEGVPFAAAVLPRARTTVVPFLSVDLPRTFDEYLESAPGRRKSVSKKLRRQERAEGLIRRAARDSGALEEFVRLHQERALTKHERHPQVDMRLAEMLGRLESAYYIELFLLELIVREKTLGVAVHLRYGDCMYGYNLGIATSEPGLGPGILLEIAGIRDALDCELKRFDLGSGYYQYKVEIGGTVTDRLALVASSKSLRSALIAGSLVYYRKARSVFGRNRLRQLANRAFRSRR